MMSPTGAALEIGGRVHALRATPRAQAAPPVWLLGSSDYSARLAASRGLPYVFAHHFSGRGTAEALALYREGFVPSEDNPEPRTFLTVNAVVAETREDAARLVLPNLLAMVALRTGGVLTSQLLVEDAEGRGLPDEHLDLALSMLDRWIVGSPDDAADAGARARHDLRRRRGDAPSRRRRHHRYAGRPLPRPGGDPEAAGRGARLRQPHRVDSSVVGQVVAQGGDHGPRRGVDGEPEDVGTVVVADRVEQPSR